MPLKTKRAQPIVDDYLVRIGRGELREGELLPTEDELGHSYGVSRSAVREAVHILVAKGLLEVRQGSGTRVAPRAHWNALDPELVRTTLGDDLFGFLIEAREIVEPAIASLAAARSGERERARMREAIDDEGRVGASDPHQHAEADIAFHEALADASGNPLLVYMHASVMQLGRAFRAAAAANPEAVGRAIQWHRHVLEAIEARDSQAAGDAMRLHMRQVRSELERMDVDQEDR